MTTDALDLHLRALYRHDEHDQLVSINQWDGGTVPLFHYAWCASGYLSRFRTDLPEDLRAALSEKFELEDLSRDCSVGPLYASEYQAMVSRYATINNIWQ